MRILYTTGDFFHVPMSINTYVQYHLASGYDLAKRDDNLQLFLGLYSDYQMPESWRISLPQRLVDNLVGETQEPLLFLGSTEEEEKEELDAMANDPKEMEALQHLYFLKLYVAIFFHDYKMAEDCLSRLPAQVEGVWVPWVVFFQCLVAVSHLPSTKGRARKELKDNIEEIKGQLIDWYNQGAPNPNAMISLIEAEYTIANNVGKKALPALKIQKAFTASILAAQEDDLQHLEALAYERAGMHFDEACVQSLSCEYLMKAHRLYDQWNAVAKVIDLETRYARKLKIAKRRIRPAANYRKQNAKLEYDPSHRIGGGKGDIKPVNLKKAVKKATKFGNKRIALTQRKVKALLSPQHKKKKAVEMKNFSNVVDADLHGVVDDHDLEETNNDYIDDDNDVDSVDDDLDEGSGHHCDVEYPSLAANKKSPAKKGPKLKIPFGSIIGGGKNKKKKAESKTTNAVED